MSDIMERSDMESKTLKGKLQSSNSGLVGKLFVYNYQYRSLGGFEEKLGSLLFHADTSNQKKLLKSFPEEAQAVMDYQSKEGWWEICERDVHEYYSKKRSK